jgi:putative ABC transport system permease protein
VKVTPGTDIDRLRELIEHDRPKLATVRTESDFGRVDRNLELISAANTGVSALALVIGAISVMNTMMLSVFERTREFGVLRAIGWSRLRVLLEVVFEAAVITFVSAGVGIGLGFFFIHLLQDAPELVGIFEPTYPLEVFQNALAIAFGTALVGAAYPATRAAFLVPLQAIRHE